MTMPDSGPTLEQWRGLSSVERDVWVDQLLERLPTPLSRCAGDDLLPRFEAEGVPFVLVPSMPVTVGLTKARLEEVQLSLERNPMQIFTPEVHVPSWEATIPMHLAATGAFIYEGRDWFNRGEIDELKDSVESLGWRVPSEAEWELQVWSVRQLTPIAFAPFGELCRDTWAPNQSLPLSADGLSRGDGHEVVRTASSDPLSMLSAMPGRRPVRSTMVMSVRPVIDLPSGTLEGLPSR